MRMLAASAVLLAMAVSAAPNPKIAEGRKQLEDLELEKAARTLAAAEAVPGNDRQQVLEILELQAVVYGTMNKEAKARDAFRELITLNPDFQLSGDHPPRVRTPFYEAKEWVAQNTPLLLEHGSATEAGVTSLVLTVKKDTLRLVKRARFVLTDGPEPRAREVTVENGVAKTTLDLPKVGWSVQVLGAKDATIFELGPFAHESKAAVAAVAPAPPPPAVTPAAEPAVSSAAPPSSPLRPIGYAVGGAGVVAVGVGVVFGVLANGARSRVTGATQDGQGLVTGVTQRETAALEQQARTQATLANVLFGVGGALAAAGVVLFFVGAPAPSSPPVSVLLSPTGLTLAGVFP